MEAPVFAFNPPEQKKPLMYTRYTIGIFTHDLTSNMKTLRKFIALPLIVGAVCTLLGAWMKILHWSNADLLLAAGLISSVIFTVLALVEIWNSDMVRRQDRIRWTVALILLGSLGGLIYLIFGRRNALQKERTNVGTA